MALQRPQPKPAQATGQTDNGGGSSSRPHIKVKAPAFIRAESAVKPRAIVNIQGAEKTGKNHMAFSYSGGPIYVHSFDIGLDGVVQKFQDSREIYVAEYELTVQPGEAREK